MPPADTIKPAAQPQVTLYGGNRANFLSSWFFIWVFRLLKLSRTFNLDDDNLALQDSEKAKTVGNKLEGHWKLEFYNKNSRKPSIRRALVNSFGVSYAFLGIYKLIGAIFLFIGSYYFLNRLIKHIELEDGSTPESGVDGHMFALGLFLCALLSSIFINQVMSESTRIGVQVRAALMVLIYRKSLRLSSVGGGVGNIAMIILAFVQLGLAALPALIILLILFPIQYKLGRLTSSISNSTTTITSSRIHLMSEILTAIKLIKIYAWELYFCDRVNKVRNKEWNRLLTGIVVKVWTFCVVFGAPSLAMLCCLCVKLLAYSPPDNTLNTSTVFTVLALFYTVRYPLIMLPVAVRATLGAIGSFERLDEFLMKPELVPLEQEEQPIDGDPTLRIYIHNADFAYEGVPDPTLKFLNLKVKQGQVIAIVGDVGAGKSSILSAIIGQLRKENGVCKIRGSISYVPHDAWLLNATLKDNILFGTAFDEKRYKEVLHICALDHDLGTLSYGDMTEIGDRGVNLSLGQRQRVSLARAVYSNSDIVLLDDPLRFYVLPFCYFLLKI
ncbi:5509_t:CDS:2 [Acaulospora morrowiae]|uniref:5509_t:CDS:1 n=1 Tax=Acaulospora morrowiae TaxID=94023 RepID=A0A9N9CSL8_9GLOM|nr:5509_t:CDS:2 [Acaulospora morrowiae]